IDEMLRLVRYIAAKIPAHDAVPGGVPLQYLFDICCNVLLYVVLFHCLRGTIDSILLHIFRHVRIFDHSLPIRHGGPGEETLAWGRLI
uniref:Uncharacterized protein n=1 Tax=Anolis carolinensis TaxID=28377 RepID=A0A803U047_ANOCA